LINYLRSGSENKKRIENVENDLQGFTDLKKVDPQRLKKLFGFCGFSNLLIFKSHYQVYMEEKLVCFITSLSQQ
jgi:hypothetical protein